MTAEGLHELIRVSEHGAGHLATREEEHHRFKTLMLFDEGDDEDGVGLVLVDGDLGAEGFLKKGLRLVLGCSELDGVVEEGERGVFAGGEFLCEGGGDDAQSEQEGEESAHMDPLCVREAQGGYIRLGGWVPLAFFSPLNSLLLEAVEYRTDRTPKHF